MILRHRSATSKDASPARLSQRVVMEASGRSCLVSDEPGRPVVRQVKRRDRFPGICEESP